MVVNVERITVRWGNLRPIRHACQTICERYGREPGQRRRVLAPIRRLHDPFDGAAVEGGRRWHVRRRRRGERYVEVRFVGVVHHDDVARDVRIVVAVARDAVTRRDGEVGDRRLENVMWKAGFGVGDEPLVPCEVAGCSVRGDALVDPSLEDIVRGEHPVDSDP